MKIKSFLIFGLIIGVVSLFAFYPKNNADPIEKEAIILRSVLTLMDKVHFKPKDINDDFSKKIYKNFLTTLDGGKRFLTQSDIDQLKQYETTLDDNIKVGNFDFFNKSVELITKAQTKTQSFYKDILSKPMSFDKNEFISYDFDNMGYAKTDKELKERWFTILKSSVLDEVVQMENSNSKDSVKNGR